MIDFVLSIFSSALGMDMRDHHDIPFALPLLMACFVGGTVGFVLVKLLVKEQQDDAVE